MQTTALFFGLLFRFLTHIAVLPAYLCLRAGLVLFPLTSPEFLEIRKFLADQEFSHLLSNVNHRPKSGDSTDLFNRLLSGKIEVVTIFDCYKFVNSNDTIEKQ